MPAPGEPVAQLDGLTDVGPGGGLTQPQPRGQLGHRELGDREGPFTAQPQLPLATQQPVGDLVLAPGDVAMSGSARRGLRAPLVFQDVPEVRVDSTDLDTSVDPVQLGPLSDRRQFRGRCPVSDPTLLHQVRHGRRLVATQDVLRRCAPALCCVEATRDASTHVRRTSTGNGYHPRENRVHVRNYLSDALLTRRHADVVGNRASDDGNVTAPEDPHDLQRFVAAQEDTYARALAELRRGRKTSHWMWFVFPQVQGLGRSPMAQRYAVTGLEEARAYLAHPLLGPRLQACADALLGLAGPGGRPKASDVLGGIDAVKLRSSMTLFAAAAAGEDDRYRRVLEDCFDGEPDQATLDRL